MPGVRLTAAPSAESFGAGIAKGLSDVANAADSIANRRDEFATKEREKADQIAVNDAENQALKASIDLRFNPQTGAMTKHGKDALGVMDPTIQSYQQTVDEIAKGLVSPRQRSLFLARAQGHGTELYAALQQHVGGEAKALDQTTTNASVALSHEQGVASAGDAGAVQRSVDRQRAVLTDFASRNGLPDEWVQLKANEAASATHSGAIENLLATGDDQAAAARYAEVKDQISGDAQTHLANALDLASTRGKSQEYVDKLLVGKGENGQPLTQQEGMDRIGKEIADPKLRQATEDRWEHVSGRMKQAAEQDRRDTMRSLYNEMADPQNPKGLDELDPAKLASLDPGDQNALRAFARHPDDRPTDKVRWTQLYRMATSSDKQDRDAFLALDLLRDLPHLSNADHKQLEEMQGNLRKDGPEGAKALAGVFSNKEVADQALKAIGVNPGDKDKDIAAKVGTFYRLVNSAVDAQQQVTGKPVGAEETQKIVDKLTAQVVTEKRSWWFDKKVPAYELPNADKFAFSAGQVPAAERDQIAAAFQQRHKRKPTDDEVVTAYNATLNAPEAPSSTYAAPAATAPDVPYTPPMPSPPTSSGGG